MLLKYVFVGMFGFVGVGVFVVDVNVVVVWCEICWIDGDYCVEVVCLGFGIYLIFNVIDN